MGRTGGLGGQVLVVDDDAAVRAVVCEVLRAEGYQVVDAATFSEAVEDLANARFDLVLADAHLQDAPVPLGDRWAVVEQIKALAGSTPVVIFTAYHKRDFAEYTARGFADLLLKPFDLDELLATVRRHMLARVARQPLWC